MRFDQRLRRITYWTAVLGMLCLGLAEMNAVYIALIVLVSAVAWMHEKRTPDRSLLGPVTINILLLAAIGFAVVDFYYISGGWIESLAHFLLAVQMAKLLLPKTDRDYAQVYLISLMNVAVAAIVTVNVFFAVAFVLYSGTVILGLILLHFHREVAEAGTIYFPEGAETVKPTPSPDMQRVVSRRFLWTLTGVIVLTWGFNITFFLFSPRVPPGLIHLSPGSLWMRLTGFSENVRLGEIGSILRDETPVMHVTLEDADGRLLRGEDGLYLRGLTYQYYDGREWSRTEPGRRRGDSLGQRELPYFLLNRNRIDQLHCVRQSISLEPIGTRTLFALPGVVALSSQQVGRVEKNELDETYRTLTLMKRPIKYTVLSLSLVSGQVHPPALVPYQTARMREERDDYLQLPGDLSDRLIAYARRIAPPEQRLSPRERARRVEAHLRSSLGYTLELTPTAGVEPVEDFLLNLRKGHCEYFASSMVVLMRILGVPARLVGGFHGGEWNDVAGWYLVKQSHAHAWVEVYLDGEGWITFDPTPAAARDQLAPHTPLGTFGAWIDYLRTLWVNNVVQYDEEQQSAILDHTRQASQRVRGAVGGLLGAVARLLKGVWDVLTDVRRLTTFEGVMTLLGCLTLSTVIVLTMRWLLLKLTRRIRSALSAARARRFGRVHVAFYQELQRVLKKKGFVRSPATTPREFVEQVAREIRDAREALVEITEAFYAVRFGGDTLKPEQERRLRSVIEDLRSTAAHRRLSSGRKKVSDTFCL